MRLIDADALIEKLHDDAEHMEVEMIKLATYAAINDVKHAPTVEPERKKGEWLDMGDFEQCSVCGGTHLKEFQSYYGKTKWIKTNYCPNCGVIMDGESDETG